MPHVPGNGDRRARAVPRLALWLAAVVVAGAVAALAFAAPWRDRDRSPRASRAAPAATTSPPATPPRYPWVKPSTDPLAPAAPVPAAPRTELAIPLGGCCSESRADWPIDAIVLHTTEFPNERGVRDLRRLAAYLARSEKGVHVANDASGNSIRMLADTFMGYHATYWNSTSLGIEQTGFAGASRATWLARRAQLNDTARWIAHWARLYQIPIRRCVVTGIRYNERKRVVAGRMVKRGICTHAQVDPRNRDDPGRGYPLDDVLARARAFAR